FSLSILSARFSHRAHVPPGSLFDHSKFTNYRSRARLRLVGGSDREGRFVAETFGKVKVPGHTGGVEAYKRIGRHSFRTMISRHRIKEVQRADVMWIALARLWPRAGRQIEINVVQNPRLNVCPKILCYDIEMLPGFQLPHAIFK